MAYFVLLTGDASCNFSIDQTAIFQLTPARVTVDAIKIREAPSVAGKDTGLTYNKGMSVNYDGYVIREGYVWISWISATTHTRRWMACGKANSAGRNFEPWGTFH
ncbi:SH3 domain-containing protein [Allobaculum sp. Allo2]|uniref:SH3 domain-containing protein n=1 Tax=Allobaculum sp. Allo2 TaxID=2853432 RepID=UPI001F611CD9|nr:SH3 domain-containing protein [Allobaculum sp. Allo2]UNT92445.1 SH3 domain-containing protein [Allobaculum sp. Allo2]